MPKDAVNGKNVSPVELRRVSLSLAERAADEMERGLPNVAHELEVASMQAERRARQLERGMAPRTGVR